MNSKLRRMNRRFFLAARQRVQAHSALAPQRQFKIQNSKLGLTRGNPYLAPLYQHVIPPSLIRRGMESLTEKLRIWNISIQNVA